ncbi:MAG: isoleucine--tRNA ligase [Campylobacterales bacterium]
MDYKATLFLPNPSFPMRGNLPENEPKRYQKWLDEKQYDKMKARRQGAPLFTLHDGPPYANGHTHIGHALNKVLKDMIVKQHYFAGYDVRFTPGWDCHGLPIEQQVEKALGAEKKELTPKGEIRRLCREHAAKFVAIQKSEFQALGVMADWDKPYVTMDYRFEAEIYRELCRVAKAGLLVERKKPVYWSWAAKTALAEAEVEYQDKESDSIFVAFNLTEESCKKLGVAEAKAVIWTTTPWTLPANVAIALNPDEVYITTTDGFLVARERYQSLIDQGVITGDPARSFEGNACDRLEAINPLNGHKSLLIMGRHVSMEDGTGLVHTAPGHGEDDYRAGLLYDLPVVMPVDENGCYDQTIVREKLLPDAESFVGMHIFKANAIILEKLGGALLKHTRFKHSYPHCWRTHTPVIFRATRQWFIAMDENYAHGKSLREVALKAIEGVTFHPETGRNRLKTMVEGRPDWCISRQRDWGVPIAFLRDKQSGEVVYDEAVLNKTAELFEQEGCDAWVNRPVADFLPAGFGTPADRLEKVTDILDVWFDSGSTQAAVLRSGAYDAGKVPADLYLEGSDQHRGWFQSSLLTSCAAHGHAPYKAILTHGFTVDENGNKMSKSKGNVVAPADVMNKMGSEILRLWVAMSDYRAEVKISQNILNQVAEQYRKLRNTFRFMLANIEDLQKPVSIDEMGDLDRWILARAKTVFDEAQSALDEYDFAKGLHKINSFVVVEFSGVYLDLVKDRIYCDAPESLRRRSAQSAIYHIARTLLTLIAPVLTYTADEIMEHAPAILKKEGAGIFDLARKAIAPVSCELDGEWLLALREAFFEKVDALKKSGAVKNTLEMALVFSGKKAASLSAGDLADWLTVSSAQAGEKPDGLLAEFELGGEKFWVIKSAAHKCPRCWRYVAVSENEPCDRCKGVLDAMAG